MKKEVSLELYTMESIYKTISLFKSYINIDLIEISMDKIELEFKGKDRETYIKEFFNYLIVEEVKRKK